MPDSRMSDSYYVKIDDADSYGEHFVATDLVRSTWSAAIQHAAPVSALLVRALQRCAPATTPGSAGYWSTCSARCRRTEICGCGPPANALARRSN